MQPDEVIKVFNQRGLLVRSVQAHRPELFPVDYVKPTGVNLNGVARQCYSLIHPTITQPIYQMSPVNRDGQAVEEKTLAVAAVANKRGFALLLDWTRTWDRIITVAFADESSGGTFGAKDVLPTSEEVVKKMMTDFTVNAAEMAKESSETNNEVRTILINNAALIGFVFAPTMPSPLNKCKPTWAETKALFEAYVQKVKERGSKGSNPVTENEFPVFTYTLTKDSMALNPLEVIK